MLPTLSHIRADTSNVTLVLLAITITCFVGTRLIPIFNFSHDFPPWEEINTLNRQKKPDVIFKVLAEEHQLSDALRLIL
jgi:hypothetical protein